MTGTEENELYLRKKRYIVLTAIIMLTSAAFLLFVGLSSGKETSQQKVEEEKQCQMIKSMYMEKDREQEEKREAVYFIGDEGSEIPQVLGFQKFQVIELDQISELPETGEITLVLDAVKLSGEGGGDALKAVCHKSLRIVLYHIESLNLQSESVKELLGIDKAGKSESYKGIRILDGFWTDVPMTEKRYEYQAVDLEINNGHQVYVTAYAKDYEKEEVTPLLYRHIYQNAEIFVVNGELMDDIPQGILRGVFMQSNRTYLYPVINASICAITSFPVLANENETVLKEKYNRNAKQFSEDILMPDMMTLCSNLKQKPTLFARASIQEEAADWPDSLGYYQKEVDKYNGELGIMLNSTTTNEWEAWNKEYLGGMLVGSILSSGDTKELRSRKEIIGKVRADHYTPLPVTSINENEVYMSSVYNLLDEDGRMTLNYWGSVYGYGFSSIEADMEEVYYPTEKEWNERSKEITKKVANTVDQICLLEPCTVWEAAIKIQQYSLMEPEITYSEDEINAHISFFAGAADFVLKTDRQIKETSGCKYKQTGEGMYIINADEDNVKIVLEPTDLEY